MNTRILMISTSVGLLSFVAFGFSNWKADEQTPTAKTVKMKTPSCQAMGNILTIFGNYDEPKVDFFYDFGTRFRPITKRQLEQARSIADFVSEDEVKRVVKYENISVIIIENDKQTDKRATNKGGELSKEQLEMLQAADYSTNLLVEAWYEKKNTVSSQKQFDFMSPHITVVPEKQAAYEFGKEGLISYLKESNKENTLNLDKERLQPAKLYFTVTKKGEIANVELDQSSGYTQIDRTMLELMNNTPGRWIPGENAQGEKVDQVLVVYFAMEGC